VLKKNTLPCYAIIYLLYANNYLESEMYRIRRGRDRIVVGFITTCEISVYYH